MAGMLVFMVLIAFMSHVYKLPDAVVKYFSNRTRRLDGEVPRDPDEQAARLLGESLQRAKLSSEATTQVMAVFWAADTLNRRALAQVVAGLTEAGPYTDEARVLAVLPHLRAVPECPSEKENKPPASTEIQELPRFPR
jgi:hypothetical protein